MFHQVKLHKCVACGNVMMEGDDLNNLVSSDATDLPKVTPVTPRTIIPNVPPPAKTSSKPIHSSAAQGMLSIASDTILPPEPREDSPAPPQRRNRSFLSRATTQPPKVPVPKPPDEKNKQEPALGLDFIGVDKTRDEPTLGLPGTQKNEDLFKSMSDDDTEELERNFFTEDNAEFPTEETELWTEEDENALAQFASGRRRKGFGLAVGGLLILAAIILIPIGVVLVTYAPP